MSFFETESLRNSSHFSNSKRSGSEAKAKRKQSESKAKRKRTVAQRSKRRSPRVLLGRAQGGPGRHRGSQGSRGESPRRMVAPEASRNHHLLLYFAAKTLVFYFAIIHSLQKRHKTHSDPKIRKYQNTTRNLFNIDESRLPNSPSEITFSSCCLHTRLNTSIS